MLDADALLAATRRPLLVGVGGGGDVVGALAVAEPLARLHGARPVVGGTTWERIVVDAHPGPRGLDQLDELAEHLGPGAALAGPRTHVAARGVRLAEARTAELIGEATLLVDPTGGPGAVVAGLEAALGRLGADALVLVDVGGDALAHGHEPGLSSPLCDAVLLAAGAELAERGLAVLGAVFGPGCDGELEPDEVLERVAEVAAGGGVAAGGTLTAPTAEMPIAHVPTEASAQPLRCFRGETGAAIIRRGRRTVELSPLGALTFFFSVPVALATAARLARAVRGAEDLEGANDTLHALGVRTELDLERDALAS